MPVQEDCGQNSLEIEVITVSFIIFCSCCLSVYNAQLFLLLMISIFYYKFMFQVLKLEVQMFLQIFILGQLLEMNHLYLYQPIVPLALNEIKLHYVWKFFAIPIHVQPMALESLTLVIGAW